MASDGPRRVSIAFYSDSTIISGAEIMLGTLLGALPDRIDAAIAGTDAGVVDYLAGHRPQARRALLPELAGKGDIRGYLQNARGIWGLRPEIFQANVGGGAAAQHALVVASLLPGVKTLVVEHLAVDCDNDLQRRIKRFTNRHLAGHVAVGAAAAREIEAMSGLPAGRVRSIHNGVPDVPLSPMARAFPGPVIGTVGRLHRQKGFDILLRALAALPGANLVIVGDGPDRLELEALAAELGVAPRVRFEGWSDRPRDHLTAFDIFALPSRFEGFPLAILEAMLAGLPVVATRVGSVAEAVADGETGTLVAPEDVTGLTEALAPLITDAELRAAMGARGRERALALGPAAMAAAYEALYDELLDQ